MSNNRNLSADVSDAHTLDEEGVMSYLEAALLSKPAADTQGYKPHVRMGLIFLATAVYTALVCPMCGISVFQTTVPAAPPFVCM